MSNDVMKFNYNSSHNNFPAIESLNPLDIGTEKQFMFTAKMLAVMFHVSHKTIDRRVETLIDTGDLSGTNLSLTEMPDSRGSLHEATVYDLTVLKRDEHKRNEPLCPAFKPITKRGFIWVITLY